MNLAIRDPAKDATPAWACWSDKCGGIQVLAGNVHHVVAVTLSLLVSRIVTSDNYLSGNRRRSGIAMAIAMLRRRVTREASSLPAARPPKQAAA
jgi:hypothetical protein